MMDPLTLGGTVIGILAAVAGIVAAVVQVREYLEKRRKKPDGPDLEVRPLTPPPAPQVPHNLPPRREFVGREKEKARVHEALRSRSYLVSIDGIGGIGKTVLALEVAYECLRASKSRDPTDGIATFDGFIWTTAKDRDLTLNALLDAVARTLDYPGIAQQPVEEKQIAVQRLLQEKPHLLIVDNFETITDENVRDFLLELPEPSKALITTREQKLRRAWAISLKGLTEPEALALIRNEGRRLGLAALERAEDRVLLHLYQATGGAPLAIKWAVGQIKQRGQSLDTVLTALHEARGDIFDNVFSRSWNLLSTDARQVLIVMPLFATSASRDAIEAASDAHHFALDEALGQLVEMSLVDPSDELELAQRRYSIHPLTRAFALARLQQEPGSLNAARKRLGDFFWSFTKKHGGPWNLEGFAWLEPELPNILTIIQWSWEEKLHKLASSIFSQVSHLMVVRGYWSDVMDLAQLAVTKATELGDELTAARFRVWPIGWLCRQRGNLDLAEEHTMWALSVFERLGERDIAYAKRNLSRIYQERGELERAEQLVKEAIALYELAGDTGQLYWATVNLADVTLERGNVDTAWLLSEEALAYARQSGYPEYSALRALGRVACRRGDLQQARALWEQALTQMERANHLSAIADVLFDLAQIEVGMGQEQTAIRKLLYALDGYRRLDIQPKVQEVQALIIELEGHQQNT